MASLIFKPTHLPYRALGLDAEDLAIPSYGGDTALFTAGVDLKVGDIVYLSAANTVNKSNTAALMLAFVGVVVGGLSLLDGGIVVNDVNALGAIVLAGTTAIVQINGVVKVVSDAAIVLGTRLAQGAVTPGRVDDSVYTAGQMVGIALDTAAGAAVTIPMLIQPK